jgi:hypothetical protein
MADLKHVGRVKSTKTRCLVAYRTLPGDSSNCLVILSDQLSDGYHNSIINLVEGHAAQDANEFAEILMRSTFTDGQNMLVALHTAGKLIKMSTSDIEMIPNMQTAVLLSELNQVIAEQRGVAVDDLALIPTYNEKAATDAKAAMITAEVVTPVVQETVTELPSDATPEAQAKHFRSQADKLAKQAAEMRRKAEELVPTKKVK